MQPPTPPRDWPQAQADRRSGYDRRVNTPERRKVPQRDDRRLGERREG